MSCVCGGKLECCYLCGREGKPAPSAEPERLTFPRHAFNRWDDELTIPAARLRKLLSRAGLAIVPAAEVVTAEDGDHFVETDPIGCAVDAAELALKVEGTAVNRSRIGRALKLLSAAHREELARRAAKEKRNG